MSWPTTEEELCCGFTSIKLSGVDQYNMLDQQMKVHWRLAVLGRGYLLV